MTTLPLRARPLRIALASAIVLALTLAAFAATAGHATAAPQAKAATSCNISKVSRRLGPTYVTSLSVTRVSCSSGVALVKAFHSCRLAHGKRGRCTRSVTGYACRESRSGISTQFSGRVTCRKGRATVVHTYTQFT